MGVRLVFLKADFTVNAIGSAVVEDTWYVTKYLTGYSISNSSSTVKKGSGYSATLTLNSGYTAGSITVTMGGADITSTALSGTSIAIASVTGNVVITAVATGSGSGGSDQPVDGQFAVTLNLTSCSSTNSSLSAESGSAYATKLTTTGNYGITQYKVVMGGVDVTSDYTSFGQINIPNVTGNIVITATAVETDFQYVDNEYWSLKATTTAVTSSSTGGTGFYRSAEMLDVTNADYVTFKGTFSSSTNSCYGFLKEDKKLIEKHVGESYPDGIVVKVPSDAMYFVVNTKSTDGNRGYWLGIHTL